MMDNFFEFTGCCLGVIAIGSLALMILSFIAKVVINLG